MCKPASGRARRQLSSAAAVLTLMVLAVAGPGTATGAGAATGARAAMAAGSPVPAVRDEGVGLRLLDAPVSAGDDPRARVYIVDHLAPKAVISRQIEVSNSTSTAVNVVLYSAAASIADGWFLGAAGRTADELSSWSSVSPGRYQVPARGQVTATVTIRVPRDAAPGERYGVVWAETRSAAPDQGGVTEVSRVGIRLYVSVGPGGAPPSDFTIDTLTSARAPDGRPMVLAAVHNTGGRALDLSGSLSLRNGPGGLNGGPFPVTVGVTLGIGDTQPVTIVLDPRLPAGPWQAQVTLRSGLLERQVAATITFPASGTGVPVAATAVRPTWLYPAAAGLVLLLLLSAAVGVLLVRRRNRERAHQQQARAQLFRPVHRYAAPPAPPAVRQDRRAGGQVPVSAEAEASYHWQLALADSQDGLTRLGNQSLFEDETQRAIEADLVNPPCLMLIGLDRERTVEGRFGADGTDALLVALAERLRRVVRPRDLVARLDGDQFAVLFEDVRRSDLEVISRRIIRTIGEPLTIEGHRVQVHAGLGIAQARPGEDAAQVMLHANDVLAVAAGSALLLPEGQVGRGPHDRG